MTDVIRVDLTPEEADIVLSSLSYCLNFVRSAPPGYGQSAVKKIAAAKANPLNGPTFDWSGK